MSRSKRRRKRGTQLERELNKMCVVNSSGLYEIIIGNRSYVGSSRNMKSRVKVHLELLRKGKHINSKLQYAYDTHNGLYKLRPIFIVKNPYITRYELYVYEHYVITRRSNLYNIIDVPCYSPKWKSSIPKDLILRSKQTLLYHLKQGDIKL